MQTSLVDIPEQPLSCDGKFTLTLKEPPRTIVAALRESPDSILIAADSQQIETDQTGQIRFSTKHKLLLHPRLPMAWAIVNNASIGAHFNEWLKQFDWTSCVDWYTAQQQIAEQLATLNGKQRRICQISGWNPSDPELCGVLIAAFRDEKGVVFAIDAKGFVNTRDQHEFNAFGSGFVHADVAYKTLVRIKSDASPEDKLRTIVGIAAESAPSCGPPVRMARVTPKGVSLLG